MNLATESSAPPAAGRRVYVSELQSLGEETALVNVGINEWDLKCQRVMLSDMPN